MLPLLLLVPVGALMLGSSGNATPSTNNRVMVGASKRGCNGDCGCPECEAKKRLAKMRSRTRYNSRF